jgi:zinc finger SWIM domain-containing protein 3
MLKQLAFQIIKTFFGLMAWEAGGIENLGFTREDTKNKLYSKMLLEINQGVLKYLEKKTIEDRKSLYFIQDGEDDLTI